MAAVSRLGLLKVRNFNFRYGLEVVVSHCAKCHAGDMAVFRLFKMAAVRYLEFLKLPNSHG